MTNFLDKIEIKGTRQREDGYLVVDARVARTGVQTYLGSEVGRPDLPLVRVWRPEAEVFSDAAMASFSHRPITNNHPPEAITSENWKKFAVGYSADMVARDGGFLRIPLMIADQQTIDAVNGGKRELSAGYMSSLKWDAGTTPEGEAYDAIQTDIRANHIAVVEHGRAGSACRIGDDAAKQWGVAPNPNPETKMPEVNLRTILVDGLSVATTDQGAQAIEKLLGERSSFQQQLKDQATAHAQVIQAKDKEIATKDAEIDAVKAKIPNQEAMDKMVADRANLVFVVTKLAPDIKPAGLSDADLRKAVVTAKLGADAVKDKSESYIDARFDILVEDIAKAPAGGSDPFRKAMTQSSAPVNHADAFAARQAAFDSLQQFDTTGRDTKVN